jgi:hypothetical protein
MIQPCFGLYFRDCRCLLRRHAALLHPWPNAGPTPPSPPMGVVTRPAFSPLYQQIKG